MKDKEYPELTEEFECGGRTIPVRHSVAGRKPLIRILLGPGLSSGSDDRVLENISRLAAAENIDIVRFDYPATFGRSLYKPRLRERKEVYGCVFEHILAQSEPAVPLFIGGKSISAHIAADVTDKRISGYVFLSMPFKFPMLPLRIPGGGISKLHKPMLFIQGKADELAPYKMLEKKVKRLNPYAYLMLLPDAGHSLQPFPGVNRDSVEVIDEISNVIFWFISDVIHKQKLN